MTPGVATSANLRLSPKFIGERLRQAREAYGFTAEVLGLKVGRSKQQISRYESEDDVPSHEVLVHLAEHLQQPLSYFFRPISSEEKSAVMFYRKLKKVTAPELRRVNIWRRWLEEVVHLIAEYLNVPGFDLPPGLIVPFHTKDVDLAVIDHLALQLREHWGLGQRPIGNVIRTMERHGVLLARFDVGADDMDGYSLMSQRNEKFPLVVLNSFKLNAFRSRFDAAHELGHLLMHAQVTQEDLSDPRVYERVERQAHRFASAFLLPEDAFLDDTYSYGLDVLVTLKEKWGVSLAAMAYRLLDLGIITADDHSRLRANLARRKWNKIEPFDLTTDPEQPALIAQCIEALVRDAGFTKQDVLNDLTMSPKVVERLTGLPDGYFGEAEELESVKVKPRPNLRLGS